MSEAQRFDEFNRRMAFIMHDIKNLVSQLSLLARNAKRHADNPEFRDDMIATLEDSSEKMNGLLARLSQHNKAKPEEPKPIKVAALLQSTIEKKRLLHAIETNQVDDLTAMADPARVDQILGHLIQNAVDASPEGQSIMLNARRRDLSVAIEVADTGRGMSSEFIRSQLFKRLHLAKRADWHWRLRSTTAGDCHEWPFGSGEQRGCGKPLHPDTTALQKKWQNKFSVDERAAYMAETKKNY